MDGLREVSTSPLVQQNEPEVSVEDQTKMLVDLLRPSLGVARSRSLAPALLAKFGSLPEVLTAPVARLGEVPGLGHRTARSLGSVHTAAKLLARMRVSNTKPLLSSWGELMDYCHVAMAYETIEQVRILFLNKRNRLIADEVVQTGTIDYTPVFPREVMKRALELSATALILLHNHPSGDPASSAWDLRTTRQLDQIAQSLGITLHDHVIIAKSGNISMKAIYGTKFDGADERWGDDMNYRHSIPDAPFYRKSNAVGPAPLVRKSSTADFK
jgi:DNA repair protein RadC